MMQIGGTYCSTRDMIIYTPKTMKVVMLRTCTCRAASNLISTQ